MCRVWDQPPWNRAGKGGQLHVALILVGEKGLVWETRLQQRLQQERAGLRLPGLQVRSFHRNRGLATGWEGIDLCAFQRVGETRPRRKRIERGCTWI